MHLPRLLRRWALALATSALAAPALSAQLTHVDNTPNPEVMSVVFQGVTKDINLKELQASIYTEATACKSIVIVPFCKFTRYSGFKDRHYLNRQELKRDVLRVRVFYFREGYREAQVDTTVTRLNEKEVAVTFIIRQGEPTIVSNVGVSYDSTLLTAKRVNQLTQVRTGAPLDMFELDSTRIQFQNELWELGYADALIDTSSVVDPIAHTARVQFHIVQNRVTTVGDITVQGTDKVAPNTVLNSLSFKPGDLFKRSAVLESQRNLYESNLFKLAVLEVPQTFDSVKAVNILLREAPLREARTSLGFNTVDFFQTEGRFTHHNLFGNARRLEISAAAGNLGASSLNGKGAFHRLDTSDTTITGNGADFLRPTWQASAQLSQPAFLRPRDAVAVGAFAQRRAVPSVVIDRSYGANFNYTHSLASRAPASLSYRFEVTRVEAGGPYFCVNVGVCDTLTIDALRGHQRLSPLTLQATIDRSDQPLAPTSGYTAHAEVEHASAITVSDYRYNRLFGEGTLYARMGGPRSVLASHIKLGFVRPLSGGPSTLGEAVLHPRKRFYAGGSQSVRGYGENQLGPRILTLPRAFLAHAMTTSGAPCDISSDNIRLCDPNTIRDTLPKADGSFPGAGYDKFTPRALGGTSLAEASIEYRFPLPFFDNLGGAVFIDGAAVGEKVLDPIGAGVKTLADLVRGTGAITPGFGVRYYSSVGPIRVDVGFNPSRTENLAVVTDLVKNGKPEIVALDTPYKYTAYNSLLSRFILHLSIGQAY